MAVIAALPPKWEKHPWDEWLDGQAHELIQGVHFNCKNIQNFRGSVIHACKKRGLLFEIRIKGNRVYLQALRDV